MSAPKFTAKVRRGLAVLAHSMLDEAGDVSTMRTDVTPRDKNDDVRAALRWMLHVAGKTPSTSTEEVAHAG